MYALTNGSYMFLRADPNLHEVTKAYMGQGAHESPEMKTRTSIILSSEITKIKKYRRKLLCTTMAMALPSCVLTSMKTAAL